MRYLRRHMPELRRVLQKVLPLLPELVDADEVVAGAVDGILAAARAVPQPDSPAAHIKHGIMRRLLANPLLQAASPPPVVLRSPIPQAGAARRWPVFLRWLARACYVLSVFDGELLRPVAEEDWGLVAPALEELSADERIAACLYLFHMADAADVAEALGIGEEKAERLLERALKSLRRKLAGRCLTPAA